MRLSIRYTLLALTIVIGLANLILYLHSSTDLILKHLVWSGKDAERADVAQDKLKDRLYRNASHRYRAPLDLMPKALREMSSGLPVTISAEEFRKGPNVKTGNPLIDTYGSNDVYLSGENGRGVTFADMDRDAAKKLQQEFNLNVMASDVIPLNRLVPDVRLKGCDNVTYEHDLPTATVIVPFYDEWPSVLLRTVYSIVNRTPRHLLYEVLLVDDNSTMAELKEPLDQYVQDHFPQGLVRIVRMPGRDGLIRARMKGWQESQGDVVVFFDSHMEVNIDWIEPLLTEIKKDRKTVAMSTLDYILKDTLEYNFHNGYVARYGFDWRLVFFETFFRDDQVGPTPQSARPGSTMVGAAFAMDRKYFEELGGYDTGMKVWGGENLEMSWRVWLCGGRLMHLPCSHLGHIPRGQPYSFQGNRQKVEEYNYKRAVLVWMGDYKQYVFHEHPNMKTLDAGDLNARYALRDRLKCHNFTWFLDNVWPELTAYKRDAIAWGSVMNRKNKTCLDNHDYLWQGPADLFLLPCNNRYHTQGFSLTKSGLFRTTLNCVVLKTQAVGGRPKIEDCVNGSRDVWNHTKEGQLVHVRSKLCMDVDSTGLVMGTCTTERPSQLWSFTQIPLS